MYICLGSLKNGWKAYCRPIIGVDGCHIKGVFPGQLLRAISSDCSNEWWPIVWAVVEKDATKQWKWFFELLERDLEISNGGYALTFISDRQKGLDAVLAKVLLNCDHRYCVQHIYCNFKKLHRGKPLKDMLWKIARSNNNMLYENAMRELESYDKDAYRWVVNGPRKEN